MQFNETWQQVVAGKKSETRRPVKAWEVLHDEKVSTARVGTHMTVYGRTRFAVGAEYAVQPGRGKKAVGRIQVTDITRSERAMDISPAAARREGFATADAFCAAYARLNGEEWLTMPCWVLTFRLMTPEEETP
jgi:hypothetical protein